MRTLEEALERLVKLKDMGYVKTHRVGQTGIGKTLEDLLQIEENNISISNTTFAELKSARKGVHSMLTLFTKSPLPRKANGMLLDRYGYMTPQSGGRKILHTTAYATDYNSIRGRPGYKVHVTLKKVLLVSANGEELAYWDESTLRRSFERKMHHLLYVLADWKGSGSSEEFWFNEAWLLSGFSFNSFTRAINEGVICIDTRIGQYLDGSTHDHGTGFRIFPHKLSLCFNQRRKVL